MQRAIHDYSRPLAQCFLPTILKQEGEMDIDIACLPRRRRFLCWCHLSGVLCTVPSQVIHYVPLNSPLYLVTPSLCRVDAATPDITSVFHSFRCRRMYLLPLCLKMGYCILLDTLTLLLIAGMLPFAPYTDVEVDLSESWNTINSTPNWGSWRWRNSNSHGTLPRGIAFE